MYNEIHGSGATPLLLHGGLFDVDQRFGELIPGLSADRLMIAGDFQGHGRTNDIDRPLTSAVLPPTSLPCSSTWGSRRPTFSGSAWVARWRCTWRSSTRELVRKLIMSSCSFRPDGDRGENSDAVAELTVDMLAGTPMEQAYRDKSPHPDRLKDLLDKLGSCDEEFPGWSDADIEGIATPTLITVGDCDAVKIEHAVKAATSTATSRASRRRSWQCSRAPRTSSGSRGPRLSWTWCATSSMGRCPRADRRPRFRPGTVPADWCSS